MKCKCVSKCSYFFRETWKVEKKIIEFLLPDLVQTSSFIICEFHWKLSPILWYFKYLVIIIFSSFSKAFSYSRTRSLTRYAGCVSYCTFNYLILSSHPESEKKEKWWTSAYIIMDTLDRSVWRHNHVDWFLFFAGGRVAPPKARQIISVNFMERLKVVF